MVENLCKEEDKIWTNENMELNSNTVDAVLINGRQARPDNLIPYQTFDLTNIKNIRFVQLILVAYVTSNMQQHAATCSNNNKQ